VAHELRSPLTSVKGFTATLLRRWERFTDDQKRFMLETIEHDADRVTRLIGELLDISRIDAGRLEVHAQPVDLAAAARRHVERMVASGSDERKFVVHASPHLPEVWADPDRLDQVMANLLENAVRHGDGTVTLDLVATSEVLGGSDPEPVVAVSVSDEGDGIDEENLQRGSGSTWSGGWSRRTADGSRSAGRPPAVPSSDLRCPPRSRTTWPERGHRSRPRSTPARRKAIPCPAPAPATTRSRSRRSRRPRSRAR
jgi:hypothetical protein